MSNYFTKASISGILAFVVGFAPQIMPFLPKVWADLLAAFLALYAWYSHNQVVTAARVAGLSTAKGVKI